jgi:hemerythrin superfamily protein
MSTTVDEFIKRDHDDFRLIFAWLRKSSTDEAALRGEVYPFLIGRVQAHAVAEEATIFPKMERDAGLLPPTLVLIAEHRGMDTLARDLAETPYGARMWQPGLVPLFDVMRCHLAREEADVFPRVTYRFSPEVREAAGQEFERVLRREWKIRGVHGGLPPALQGR